METNTASVPYDSKTPAEVVHDYAVVRGDLSAQYARDQLALWIERYAAEASRKVLREAADDWPEDGMTRAEAQHFLADRETEAGR